MPTTLIQIGDEFINLDHVAYAQLQGADDKGRPDVLLVALVSGQQFRYEDKKMAALLKALQQRAETALKK